MRSIAHQKIDRSNFEILVVDGGSTDGTVDIAEQYADSVILQKSRGIGGARRDGATDARGEILAFTDADTVVSSSWLESIDANLADHDSSTGPVIFRKADIKGDILSSWRDLYRIFNAMNFYYILGSNMAVRTEKYWEAKGHSEISLLDDYDLSVKLFRAGARGCYDERQAVFTSSRRASRLLTYAITVAYGHYHYLLTGNHDKLLHYPKPEDMCLATLLEESPRCKEVLEAIAALQRTVIIMKRKIP